MIFSLLDQPVVLVAWLVSIVLAITFHEFSHVLMANLLGDSTGKQLGRLTLNPLAHLDALGFFMLAVAGFGWGKPAPFNPYNLRLQRFGPAIVALAGPVSNLVIVFLIATVYRGLILAGGIPVGSALAILFEAMVQINLMLAIFNLIPIPPLDGSKVLESILPASLEQWKVQFERTGPMILIGLVILDSFLGLGLFSGIFVFFSRWILGILGVL